MGYALTLKIVSAYNKTKNMVVQAVHFRFDKSYSSLPSDSLLEKFKNFIKPIKINNVKVIKFDSIPTLFPESDIIKIDLLITHESSQLNITILDDELYNISYIKSIPVQHKWYKILTDRMRSNL